MKSDQLPHSIDNEKGLLGSILLAPSRVLIECADRNLSVQTFHHPAHQTIFRSLQEMAKLEQPIDMISLTTFLEQRDLLKKVGEAAAITDLFTFVPSASNARYYMDVLRDLQAAREAILTANQVIEAARNPEFSKEVHGIINSGLESIAQLFDPPAAKSSQTLKQQIDDLCTELEQTTAPFRYGFGLAELDRLLAGGAERGDLMIVAGNTSGGKSILLGMMAILACQSGRPTVFYALEMTARACLRRFASNLAGARVKGILENPSKLELDRTSQSILRMSEWPLVLRDHLLDIDAIERDIARLAAQGLAELVVVDYLGLVQGVKADTKSETLNEVALRCKAIAKKHNCVLATASQLNDDGKLYGSRGPGHHADIVLNIVGSEEPWLSIDKQRNGPRNVSVPVTLRGDIARFDFDEHRIEEKPEKPQNSGRSKRYSGLN